MPHSDSSSSEVRINYQDSKGHNLIEDSKKPQTSDTDYYFNMIANPTKVVLKESSSSSSSEFNDMLKNTESDVSNSSRRSASSSSSTSRHSRSSDSRQRVESIALHSDKREDVSPKPIPFPPMGAVGIAAGAAVASNVASTQPAAPKVMTMQEIRMRKIELLRKLSEIKTKGYKLTKEYDFNSSLEEMEYEYDLLRSFADKRNGVKIFRNGLLQAVSVVEFLNDRYDPFDFHLSGWSDHMAVEIDSWEDVLEELYEKYKGSGKKMAPEVKLLYLIIASAGAFHFTKSQAAKVPGLDSMLASNPGLVSGLINGKGKKEESQFVSAQELSIQQQKEELKKREMEARMRNVSQQAGNIQQQPVQRVVPQPQPQQQNIKYDTSSSINNILNSQIFGEPMAANSKPLPKTISANQLKVERPDIRTTDQVKDILSRIHNIQPTIKTSNTETQDDSSSVNDRLVSETTLSESKKRGPKKKVGISIV